MLHIVQHLSQFQFHYGTIKSRYIQSPSELRNYFNSTMVRLKVSGPREDVNPNVGFQFHYGTIKRPSEPITRSKVLSFQFHYGTIKSLQLG